MRIVKGIINVVATLALTAVFVKLADASGFYGNVANSFFNSYAFGALQGALHVDPNDSDVLAFCFYSLPCLVVSIALVYAGNRLLARRSKVPVLVPVGRASR